MSVSIYRERVNVAAIFSDTSAFVDAACAHIIRIVVSIIKFIVVVVVFVIVVDGHCRPSSPRSHSRCRLLTARLGPGASTSAPLEPCLELGPLFVLAVASRTRTDADFDRLSPEYDARVFQCEDDLDRTTCQSTDARTEAHKLEQVRHPLRAGCQQIYLFFSLYLFILLLYH